MAVKWRFRMKSDLLPLKIAAATLITMAVSPLLADETNDPPPRGLFDADSPPERLQPSLERISLCCERHHWRKLRRPGFNKPDQLVGYRNQPDNLHQSRSGGAEFSKAILSSPVRSIGVGS